MHCSNVNLNRAAARAAVVAAVASACLLFGSSSALAARVSCGQTIVTSTKLANDLIDCPSNGIVIGADNVTLDLNGHVVDGDAADFIACAPDEPCDLGVFSSGHSGITIKNGTVHQFTFGAIVEGAENARVSGMTLNDNLWSGLIVAGASHTTVEGVSVSGNGLTTDQAGIDVFDSHDLEIERNSVVGNGDIGFYVIGLDDSVFDHNAVARNPEAGIILEGSGNQLTRNRFSESTEAGIVVSGDHNTVSGNQLSSTGCDGDCGVGISLEGGTGNLLEGNNAAHFHKAGIFVGAFEEFGGPPTTGNTVSGNLVRDSDLDGVLVDVTATHTIVQRNLAIGSGDDGIDVDNATATLTENVALRNGDLGIEAVPGVIDGGGNAAHANGNRAQCTSIVCK